MLSALSGAAAALGAAVPIGLDADTARELARRELADPVYQQDRPGLFERAASWLLARLSELVDAADAASPGGIAGLVVLVVLLGGVVVLVRRRLGAPAATARAARPTRIDAGPRPAAEHRREAAAAEAEGRHDDAVRSWMRALVRGLEERDLLAPRPGRTAGEVVREVGRVLPAAAGAVATAAHHFDETAYGERPADAAAVAAVRDADARVRAERPVPVPGAAR